jgi:hypothetical protein
MISDKELILLGEWLIEKVKLFPGFPVTIRFDGEILLSGVVGLELDEEDWMSIEVDVDNHAGTQLAESIALEIKNQKRRNHAVPADDPGGTRTLNQLIKRRLRKDGKPAKKPGRGAHKPGPAKRRQRGMLH